MPNSWRFELDKRIVEVKKVAEENGVDVSSQVKELEARASQLRHETYSRLTPIQRLQVARHPNRPTFLDIVLPASNTSSMHTMINHCRKTFIAIDCLHIFHEVSRR